MFRVIGCVTEQHDLGLVALAAVICVFACVTAMGMFARARSGGGNVIWIAATGVVAGAGIWSTHFVAMLAYHSGFPISYGIDLTAASIVIAIAVSTLGVAVALQPGRALAGGAIVGAAIVAMHFVGMSALDAPAVMTWDASYVAAAAVIAIAATSPAFYIAMQPASVKTTAAGAGLLALGICGLHFTAMSAVTLTPTALAAAASSPPTIVPATLAVAVAAVSLLIVGLGFVCAVADQHLSARSVREAERLRVYVAELEKTKSELEATSVDLMKALNAASAGSQAKSQFLAAMSHELRTPLNAVIGFSEMLVSEALGPLGDPRYRDYAADIRRSGGHLLSLINDILDLARLDAASTVLHEESIDWRELIEDTLAMVRNQAASAALTLAHSVEPNLPPLRGDRRRVMQVLLNLASNAIKFTPSGGQVRVAVARQDGGVAITVSDTGIGMEADDIPKALERFGQIDSSLSRKYEGTGLGLPLAKQLMELHGGTLVIESQVTVGTKVTVTFPATRLGPTKDAAAA